MNKLKSLILSIPYILALISFLYNSKNLLRVKSNHRNELKYSKSFLRKTRILIKKEKNSIRILSGSYLNNCSIAIYGKNNKVIINENCSLKDVELHIEDDNNSIVIGRGTTIAGKTHLACIEGTNITIGDDCMFSKDIVFRTGDSHSIIDEKGLRINTSKNISIGNHVWVGNNVIIVKGACVSDNCIIGTGSIVTKAFLEPSVILAGSPAKIVKERINWLRKRI